jgi:transcriptional regulator with XRE-family HTH domain
MKDNGKRAKKDNTFLEKLSLEEQPYSKFCRLIKEARIKCGISQETLACAVNTSQSEIWGIETGRVKNPRIDKVVEIFYVLGLDIKELNKIFIPDVKKIVLKDPEEMDYSEFRTAIMYRTRKSIKRKQ